VKDRDATADWLLSDHGRIARIVAGSLLIIIGLGIIGGFLRVLLLILGAVPIASAAYGTLLIGPLLGRDIRGRRPEDQPPEEEDAGDDEDEEPRDDGEDDEPSKQPDEDWSAPPVARAERPEGEGPRTKDPRAEDDTQT
jgi:hypothetical protein